VNLFEKSFVVPDEEGFMRSKMAKLQKKVQIVGVIVLPLLFSACFSLQIIDHVPNPDAYFKKAYAEIERLQQENPAREGRAHRLSLLIHDSSSDEIIRLTVPLWLVPVCLDLGAKATEHENHHFDYDERYEVDWKALKDLGQFGPGLLVAVDDERDKILIWLK